MLKKKENSVMPDQIQGIKFSTSRRYDFISKSSKWDILNRNYDKDLDNILGQIQNDLNSRGDSNDSKSLISLGIPSSNNDNHQDGNSTSSLIYFKTNLFDYFKYIDLSLLKIDFDINFSLFKNKKVNKISLIL